MLYVNIVPIWLSWDPTDLQLSQTLLPLLNQLASDLKQKKQIELSSMYTDGRKMVAMSLGFNGVQFTFPGFDWRIISLNEESTFRQEVWFLVDRSKKTYDKSNIELALMKAQLPAHTPLTVQHFDINYSVISLCPENKETMLLNDADFQEKFVKPVAKMTKSNVNNFNVSPHDTQEGYSSILNVLKDLILAQAEKSMEKEKAYKAEAEQKKALAASTNTLKVNAVAEVCDQYKPSTSYFFPAHATRHQAVIDLKTSLNAAKSKQEVIAALVGAARDIRTPDAQGRFKYGFTFFRNIHIGYYENSSLYKLIDSQLKKIDPGFDLASASAPTQEITFHAAGLRF
jgi:hypothetical protein